MSNAELASSYAALILADDGVEVTVSHYIRAVVAARKTIEGRKNLSVSSRRTKQINTGITRQLRTFWVMLETDPPIRAA